MIMLKPLFTLVCILAYIEKKLSWEFLNSDKIFKLQKKTGFVNKFIYLVKVSI